MGFGLTGKLGGACDDVLPGLVRLDLEVGGGLDGDGEEVVGVVLYTTMPCTNPCTAQPAHQPQPHFNPT